MQLYPSSQEYNRQDRRNIYQASVIVGQVGSLHAGSRHKLFPWFLIWFLEHTNCDP